MYLSTNFVLNSRIIKNFLNIFSLDKDKMSFHFNFFPICHAYTKLVFCYPFFSILESTQLEDPRQEWRAIQESMLREYLHTAQDVLEVRLNY